MRLVADDTVFVRHFVDPQRSTGSYMDIGPDVGSMSILHRSIISRLQTAQSSLFELKSDCSALQTTQSSLVHPDWSRLFVGPSSPDYKILCPYMIGLSRAHADLSQKWTFCVASYGFRSDTSRRLLCLKIYLSIAHGGGASKNYRSGSGSTLHFFAP